MPISPTPPSGAKTSSSFGDVISAIDPSGQHVGGVERQRHPSTAAPRAPPKMGFASFDKRSGAQSILRDPVERKYLAGRNRHKSAIPDAQHQPARLVDRLETPGRLALGKPHPDRLPKPQGAGEPSGPDTRKAGTAVPLSEARLHGRNKVIEQRSGANIAALGGEIRRRKFGPVRM